MKKSIAALLLVALCGAVTPMELVAEQLRYMDLGEYEDEFTRVGEFGGQILELGQTVGDELSDLVSADPDDEDDADDAWYERAWNHVKRHRKYYAIGAAGVTVVSLGATATAIGIAARARRGGSGDGGDDGGYVDYTHRKQRRKKNLNDLRLTTVYDPHALARALAGETQPGEIDKALLDQNPWLQDVIDCCAEIGLTEEDGVCERGEALEGVQATAQSQANEYWSRCLEQLQDDRQLLFDPGLHTASRVFPALSQENEAAGQEDVVSFVTTFNQSIYASLKEHNEKTFKAAVAVAADALIGDDCSASLGVEAAELPDGWQGRLVAPVILATLGSNQMLLRQAVECGIDGAPELVGYFDGTGFESCDAEAVVAALEKARQSLAQTFFREVGAPGGAGGVSEVKLISNAIACERYIECVRAGIGRAQLLQRKLVALAGETEVDLKEHGERVGSLVRLCSEHAYGALMTSSRGMAKPLTDFYCKDLQARASAALSRCEYSERREGVKPIFETALRMLSIDTSINPTPSGPAQNYAVIVGRFILPEEFSSIIKVEPLSDSDDSDSDGSEDSTRGVAGGSDDDDSDSSDEDNKADVLAVNSSSSTSGE